MMRRPQAAPCVSGGMDQQTLNNTGQQLDRTGMLSYHMCYYDSACVHQPHIIL